MLSLTSIFLKHRVEQALGWNRVNSHRHKYHLLTMIHCLHVLDSEYDFRSGCRNVSHFHQQQSF